MTKRRRHLAGIAAFLFSMTGAAVAGDIASFQPIGFTTDGAAFVFEEHGVQDGSGFPYSNIYAVDLETDSFISGTPVRVRLDDETKGLAEARQIASMQAAPVIAHLDIGDHPGYLAAFNPVSEADADPHRIRYYAHGAVPPFGAPNTVVLEEQTQAPPERCASFMDTVSTFRLRLTEREGVTADQLLYEDSDVPQSRNCPTGYRLAGMMTHYTQNRTVHVALVMVLSHGFEGNNGRWIAVPIKP